VLFSVALHDRVLLESGTEQCGVGGVISCYTALMSSAMWCSSKLRKYCYDMIYLTAVGLPPSGSSTVHIYTQIIHRTTQSTHTIHRTTHFTNLEKCGLYPIFASYTLAFALQLRKKHGRTSVRVVGECRLA
jgi:hypothetical protein